MAARYDIRLACVPFTAGTALACMIPDKATATAAMIMGPCAVMLALWFLRRGGRSVIIAALATAGMFCLCSSRTGVTPYRQPGGLSERAMDSLCSVIDSLEFTSGETGPMIKALVTGRQEELPEHVSEAFRQAGTAHILALSGMHLCLLYGLLSALMAWTGGNKAALMARSVVSVAACGFYCAMAGNGPSLFRAFLFVLFNEIARNLPGRGRNGPNIFCAALTVQLAIDPSDIRSAGFQLSYLSVLAIMTLYPKLDSLYPAEAGRIRKRIWSAAALSISCQLYTAPAVMLYFGTFPRYFLIGNLVGVPLSTALIFASVVCIALEAAGICPEFALRATQALGQALILSMETIRGLT